MAVVVYRNSTYEIQASRAMTCGERIAAPSASPFDAGQLAHRHATRADVDRLLASATSACRRAPRTVEPYDPGISLDYIGQEFGVTTNTTMGGYVGGGIALSFGDMLGDHVITHSCRSMADSRISAARSGI